MSVTNKLIAATLLLASSQAAIVETNDVGTCVADDNARFCLKDTVFTESACCDSTIDCSTAADACTAGCLWAWSQETLCASKAELALPSKTIPINSRFMRDNLIPSKADVCPGEKELIITQTGDAGRKYLVNKELGFQIDQQMPAADGNDWKCKTQIKVDGTTLPVKPYTEDNAGTGYIYFAPEQYCFGRWVLVVVQPNNGYYDYNRLGETDDPAQMSKIWSSKFGIRYLVPAEYNVIVSFSPSGNDPIFDAEGQAACSKGSFKLWGQHVTDAEAAALTVSTAKPYADYENASDENKEIELKTIIKFTPRLVLSADGSGYTLPTAILDGASDEDLLGENIAADKLPDQPLSSDGGTPQWYETIYNEKVLFAVAGTEITAKQTFWAASGVLIIILICVVICMVISYWKRKRIAAEARRASNYVRRSTATLRASIRKARGKPTPEDEAKPMTGKEIDKAANAGGESKQEKAMLKDMMVAQNDEEEKEGGWVELPNNSMAMNKVGPANE